MNPKELTLGLLDVAIRIVAIVVSVAIAAVAIAAVLDLLICMDFPPCIATARS